MKALVTGATGLVGAHLVAQLLRDGHSVTALLREHSCTQALEFVLERAGVRDRELELLRLDSSDYGAMVAAFGSVQAEVVYHCAAIVSLGSREGDMVRENVELTAYVVDACLAMEHPSILVHVGSIAALGSSSDPLNPASEDTVFESIKGSSPYGRSKFLCQMEVVRGAKLGLRTVTVHPSVILGFIPRGGGLQALMKYGFSHPIRFYPSGGNGFVDVRDVARAMVLLSQRPQCWGESFLLSGLNCSFKELIEAINHAASHQTCKIKVGRWGVKIALFIMTISRKKSSSKSSVITQTLTKTSHWRGSKVVQTLTPLFNYSTLEETLGHMYLSYSKMPKNKECQKKT